MVDDEPVDHGIRDMMSPNQETDQTQNSSEFI